MRCMEAIAKKRGTMAGLLDCRRTPRSSFLRLSIVALCALAPGCAYRRLEINTVKQAQTVVELEYKQILDNLAMFCLNPSALPSLVTLKTGASQVGDTGTLGFLGVAGLNTTFGSSPTVTGTRTIVDQWGSSPVTDDNNLLLLSKAFRCALGYHDLIDEDDANDLAHDLSPQIGTTSDMSVDRDTLGTIFSQNLVSNALARFMPPDPARKNPPPGTPEYEALHNARRRELQTLADRLAVVNEIIDSNITDTLHHEILAKSFAFRYSRLLDVTLVKDAKELREEGKDQVWVAAVKGGLRLLIFDSDGKQAYDIQLMPWLHDRDIPPSGKNKNLIIAAFDNEVPFFRIFDADGVEIVNTVKTREPPQSAVEYLRSQFDQHGSTMNLPASEKNRIISAVISIADSSALEKIKDLQRICDPLWSLEDEEVERRYKREIIERVAEITGLKSSLKERFEPVKYSSTGLAKETIYRLNDVQKTLDEIPSGWLRRGPKKPKDACYVGHACFCGKECYVWVCPDELDGLSKFTRAVL